MEIKRAIEIIEKFSITKKALPINNNDQELIRISQEFNNISADLKDYIQYYAPQKDIFYETGSNPLKLYGLKNLTRKQDGYNYNPVTKKNIENWNKDWFLIADEGADPIIIDLNSNKDEIIKLMHGVGNWECGVVIADSIGQFILCATALDFALTNFEDEAIIDDGNSFCLAKNASEWYFKNMKEWAREYYEEWCSIFDNY